MKWFIEEVNEYEESIKDLIIHRLLDTYETPEEIYEDINGKLMAINDDSLFNEKEKQLSIFDILMWREERLEKSMNIELKLQCFQSLIK